MSDRKFPDVPSRMKALRIRVPQQMQVERVATPEPGTGDALVRVHGASYTPGELGWPSTWVDRRGRPRTPVVPGHEVSGTVAALGFGVTGLEVGDEVFGLTDWYRDGSAAEYISVEARNLAPKPKTADHAQSATLPLAGLTAYQGLFEHGQLRRGQRVAILGAAGGVGMLAVQLAKRAGAIVVGVGPLELRGQLEALGADEYLGWPGDMVMGMDLVDLVFDTMGGDVATHAARRLRRGGRIVSIVEDPSIHLQPRAGNEARFFVVVPDRPGLIELAAAVDAGELRPSVGLVCPLELAQQAIADKERGSVLGKIAFDLTATA